MNKTPQRFLKVARAQLGVPFVPQGRAAFHALDCIGLPIVCCIASGFKPKYISDYELNSGYSETLLNYLEQNAKKIDIEKAQPSDLVLFWITNPERPRHLGILTDTDNTAESVNFGLIHTSQSVKKVVEHDLDFKWQKHLHSVWRLTGMKDYNKEQE